MEKIQVEPWYLDVRGEIVRPDQVQVTTKYFWSRWAPKFGPLGTCLLLRLRQYCYFNRATGEKRDWCFPSQDTLAQELGVQNRKTVMEALRRLEVFGFVRREKQYRYDPVGRRKRGSPANDSADNAVEGQAAAEASQGAGSEAISASRVDSTKLLSMTSIGA